MGCRKLIWTPEDERPRASFARGIGGRVSGRRLVNAPVIPSAGFNGNFASLFTGAYQVVQSDLGITYGGTLLAAGSAPPVITLTGALATTPVPILVSCTLAGVLGTWTGTVSYDGGATVAQTFTSSPTVPLTGAGTGLTLNIATGTATASATQDTWTATCAGWADQSGNAHHYSQATPSKQPVIGVGMNGKIELIGTAAANTVLASAMALPAQTATPTYIYGIVRQDTWGLNLGIAGPTNAVFGVCLVQSPSTTTDIQQGGFGNAGGHAGITLGTWGRVRAWYTGSASNLFRYGATDSNGLFDSRGADVATGYNLFARTSGASSANCRWMLFVATPNLPTAPQIAAIDAAVTTWAGAGVAL
jgi:hypothetical protein